MKTKAALLIIFFWMAASGYGFASAEDALPLSVKLLIQTKSVAELEGAAVTFSESGNKFFAALAHGEASLLRGDWEQAEKYFHQAQESNPLGIEGKIGRARALAAGKETQKAIQMLNDALLKSPHPVRLHYEKGLILEAAGDLQGAAGAFEQGLDRYFSKR
jgi:tetratricopeptide (TPR) repeat protein